MVFDTFDLRTFIILHVIILAQCVFTTTYMLLKAKKTPTTYSMIFCQFLLLLWLFFRFPENMATTTEELLFTMKFSLFPIFFIGVSWLIFALFYTESITTKNKKTIILLIAPIVITFLPVLTQKHFNLIVIHKTIEDPTTTKWGVFFWIFYIINVIYISIGVILVIKKSISACNTYKIQIILVLVSVLTPFLSNIIGFLKLFYIPFDITPISFSISFMLLSISIFKFKFLDVSPFAMKEVFNSMNESVLITDRNYRIIDYNNSLSAYMGKLMQVEKDQTLQNFFESLKQYAENINELENTLKSIEDKTDICIEMELNLNFDEKKYFSLYTKPVFNNRKFLIGRIFTFRDVTSYKKLVEEINDKNKELIAKNKELIELNEQLKDYSKMVEQLTLERERNRFSRDLHDTMGHTMTLLITLLKVTQINCCEDPSNVSGNIKEAIEIAQAGMKELRQAVAGLYPETLEKNNLLGSLNDLIHKSKSLGIQVELSVQGEIYETLYTQKHLNIIYRTCQEALTNSIRHGQAKHVSIILNLSSHEIKLYIFDNGKGCSKINKSKGLSGMEERIKSLSGTVIFGSGEEGGFNINAVIPA